MKKYIVIFCAVAVLSLMSSFAKNKIRITGIYSDMAYNHEGGDLLGQEIFIVATKKGYFVIFQYSEGEPNVPVIIPADIKGAEISFIIPGDVDPRGMFRGTIGDEGLKGEFSGNNQRVFLKRKNSYWQ